MSSVDQHLDVRVGGKLLPEIFIEVVVAPRHDEQPVRHALGPPRSAVVALERSEGRKVEAL
jgi:hypothetical protein